MEQWHSNWLNYCAYACTYFTPVTTSEISVISISASTRNRKMFLFLVLMLVRISPQCTLAFSCAYACAFLTSVNQASQRRNLNVPYSDEDNSLFLFFQRHLLMRSYKFYFHCTFIIYPILFHVNGSVVLTKKRNCSETSMSWDRYSLFPDRAVRPSGTLCCVLGQDTLLSQCISPSRSINGYRRIVDET